MLEIGLGIAVCMVMVKVAEIDGRSPLVWGAVTVVLCVLSFALPWGFLRVLLAGLAAFLLMFVSNFFTD